MRAVTSPRICAGEVGSERAASSTDGQVRAHKRHTDSRTTDTIRRRRCRQEHFNHRSSRVATSIERGIALLSYAFRHASKSDEGTKNRLNQTAILLSLDRPFTGCELHLVWRLTSCSTVATQPSNASDYCSPHPTGAAALIPETYCDAGRKPSSSSGHAGGFGPGSCEPRRGRHESISPAWLEGVLP